MRLKHCWKQEADIDSSKLNNSLSNNESLALNYVIDLCVKLQETVKLHEKKLAEQEKRIMELESKQTVNQFKAIDCLQAPSRTRPRDQAEGV